MAALPYALPAAAASLAYLNARHGLTYDFALITALVRASIGAIQHNRRGTFNTFYELEAQAKSSRSLHTWIIFQGQSWTYAQAYDIVLKYGAWFKSKGVEKDEIVAMDFMNSEVFIWVWFGLWSIGAKPAFVNYNLTGDALLHSIRSSTAGLVLVDENGRDKYNAEVMNGGGFASAGEDSYTFEAGPTAVPGSSANNTTPPQALDGSSAQVQRKLQVVHFNKQLESEILAFSPVRLPDSARAGQKADSTAILIYTSGTTGLPKPAVISWSKCTIGTKMISSWIGLRNDVFYTAMPLYHTSAAILGVCSVLGAGSTICLSKKFSHATFWPEIRASNATIFQYVGETCRYLLSAPPSPLDKSHKIRGAFGNGLRPDVWEPFKERFGVETIFEFYGATESPGGLSNRSANTFSSGAIGRNGTVASILSSINHAVIRMDPEDPASPLRDPKTGFCSSCDWNEPGELMYKLDPNDISKKFQGYFGNAQATNSKIIRDVKKKGDAWFRSGDLLRKDSEGRWWFVDRTGDTFRWKAENVSTAQVSEVIGKHEAIVEANVYGVQVPRHDGRAGCAALILKPSATQTSSSSTLALPTEHTLRSLAAHVRQGLPAFAVPLFLRVTQQMQITGTNKQQKHLLQKDGIDYAAVEKAGDVLYWLRGDTYVRFGEGDLKMIDGGEVKL